MSDMAGKAAKGSGRAERERARYNGANGMSDMAGKAAIDSARVTAAENEFQTRLGYRHRPISTRVRAGTRQDGVEVPNSQQQRSPRHSLGNVPRCGDAFPFRRQVGKIMGHSGEIAIDCNGIAA
jgi:hypothetical protein